MSFEGFQSDPNHSESAVHEAKVKSFAELCASAGAIRPLRAALHHCALFANGQRMAKVLALIALVLLSGFSGGGDAFATTHATRMVLQAAAGSPGDTDATGMSHDGQTFDFGASEAMDVPEGECCTDSSCANVGHCHHGGLSAMLAAHIGSIGSKLSGGYGLPRHDIPTQNNSESISKPPKA